MSTTQTRWHESFLKLATKVVGEPSAHRLLQKYNGLFSDFYISLVPPSSALKDALQLDQIAIADCQRVTLLKPSAPVNQYRLHFYSRQERYLDEYIPVLENLNLRVMDQVQFAADVDAESFFIKSFSIKAETGPDVVFVGIKKHLLAAIQAVMDQRAENDALNKLIVLCGLAWQEVDVLRAYRNYFMQLGQRSSRDSIHHALLRNPVVALALFRYFEARFRPGPDWIDPMIREEQALLPLRLQLLDSMAAVADLNDDRILRTLFNLIDATMRSNYHLRQALDDYFIAFKINSLGIIDMPMPRPQFEIYVHAVDMEGIHLRAGKISRGGIRWSDRPDDFRTEILDLMQTQISKNSLIIPTGAKGGFVVKSDANAPSFKAAGKQAYIRLIEGMLDLTDNYDGGAISRSSQVVAYDDADPYLVVAADKGTAQFSDIANGVSERYQFWLGDAFASGGSRGYNHKVLGITARGAWECVKRHFRETGKNIQKEAFCVVGIGSMDGDVFGNGMLLSPFIRLKAAISGQHVFIDPNPADDDKPYNERKRLFDLPGSNWNDYDRTLISSGGGVYAREDKDIPVSPEVRKWLGIRYKSLDGESLIRYLLTASVDLLWLGGIGTYVKATLEKHEEVGDRANDNVRVNASDVKAVVVGEGANLGFTQPARIEFALRGGRINTDAVDNSGGVDTSDHEVNLKILLSGLQQKNLIEDYQTLFREITEDVCRLVLADNYAQSLCLSLDLIRCSRLSNEFVQLAERLEDAGFFDRSVESFPSLKEVSARSGQSISRPELAVLIAAGKRYLTHQLEKNPGWLAQKYCDAYFVDYFPDRMVASFRPHLASHPLANTIKATMISNKIINQAGCGFLNLTGDNGHGKELEWVGCYLAFDQALDADRLRRRIHALDNRIPADLQYRMLLLLEETLAGFCRWTQTHGQVILPDAETIGSYRGHLQSYFQYFGEKAETFIASAAEDYSAYLQAGVPEDLARTILLIAELDDFPLIVHWSTQLKLGVACLMKSFEEVSGFLELSPVFQNLTDFVAQDEWSRQAATYLLDDFKQATSRLAERLIASGCGSCGEYFALSGRQVGLARYRRLYREISSVVPVNPLPYLILKKELEKLSFEG